jgi:hypothetical protein
MITIKQDVTIDYSDIMFAISNYLMSKGIAVNNEDIKFILNGETIKNFTCHITSNKNEEKK